MKTTPRHDLIGVDALSRAPLTPGVVGMSTHGQEATGTGQAWFWSGFAWVGWVLVAGWFAYELAIVDINAGTRLVDVPDAVFNSLTVIGVLLGPMWVALTVARVLAVWRRRRGGRGERALLACGLMVCAWHFASYFVFPD
jgi:hypothetical protein